LAGRHGALSTDRRVDEVLDRELPISGHAELTAGHRRRTYAAHAQTLAKD
jgi:hypothetical protein